MESSTRRCAYDRGRRRARHRQRILTLLLIHCSLGRAAVLPPGGGYGHGYDLSDPGEHDEHSFASSSRPQKARMIVREESNRDDVREGRSMEKFEHANPIDFDVHRSPLIKDDDVLLGTGDGKAAFEDDRHHQWEILQEDWNANWESTLIDPDSRGASAATSRKGKDKATTPFSDKEASSLLTAGTSLRKASPEKDHLKYTRQRSPFHTSQIGTLASRAPHSIGLFRPNYPFTPSGRRRKLVLNYNSSQKKLSLATQLTSAYHYRHHSELAHSNVMKLGWTANILDDDAKLSVPDEMRRTRQASRVTRQLWGKKWFRWKPGEGYTLSRTKDLSVYKQGPGIALAHLLPPREKPVLSSLPMIPNDSKRDFVWLIVCSIVVFAILALVKEYRLRCRTNRKGKRRTNSLLNGAVQRTRRTSSPRTRKPRQRVQAQTFRGLCNFALNRTSRTKAPVTSSPAQAGPKLQRVLTMANGITSGRETVRTTRRSAGPSQGGGLDDEGASIEMLEKGGVEENHAGSPTSPTRTNRRSTKPAMLTTVSVSYDD